MLQPIAPELWVAPQPLRFFGFELGTRMTIVRLSSGRLLLHSPIAHAREIAAAVLALGRPSFLVAPNRFHHLFVQGWQAAFPDCEIHVAPGLKRKCPDLTRAIDLGDSPPPVWSDVLDQVVVEGLPLLNEVVFFHRPSATLLASDLVFNIGARSPLATRLFFRLANAYGRPATTLLERLAIRDRAAFRRSLARILAWPFDRVVIAHGEVIERDGRAALETAYAWLVD